MPIDKTITNPGFHRQFRLERFGPDEQRILDVLSRQWYMTSSGAKLRLAASRYDYFLMKPTKMFTEMFNIERELIVVLSPYPNFESRSLDVFDEAQKQLSRLEVMHPDSSEATIIRTYIDWILDVPWKKSTRDILDLIAAKKVLDEDHYGLERVKERTLG